MKLNKNKLYEAMSYIVEINSTNFMDIDCGDLFDDGTDLTIKEKEQLYWSYERFSNIEILQKILNIRVNGRK